MRYLGIFLRLWGRQLAGIARSFGEHSRLKVGVLTLFALLFWAFMYAVVCEAIGFVDRTVTVDISRQIDLVLFPLFFFSLLLMLSFSNGIIGYTALFRSKETRFLISQPLPPAAIYLAKLAESLVFSSWAFAFIGLPVILAFGVMREARWAYYPLSLLLFLPFALLPAALGNGVALALVRYMPRGLLRSLPRWGRLLGLAAAGVLAAGSYGVWRRMHTINKAHSLFSETGIGELFGRLEFLQNPLLPSYWMGRAVLLSAHGGSNLDSVALYGGVLLANGLLLVYLTTWFAERQLTRAIDLAGSHGSARRAPGAVWVRPAVDRGLFFLSARTRIFLVKDIQTFLRDPVQWSQFLLLFGLLAFYILNLRTFNYEARPIFYRHLVAFLNLAATALTMTTFASRFVFPLLSLEGRRFWVLGIAPVRRRTILLGKFAFSVVGLLAISQSLTVVSCYMLRVPLAMAAVHCMTMVTISLGISGLSVGLGAIYPNFAEDNPSKIVAGFGGTLNLVLSLLFILLVIAIEAIPSHVYFVSEGAGLSGGWVLAAVGLALVVGLVVCWIPLRLGIRAFERLEF